MSLTKRSNKGSALTYTEVDDNFTHLGGDGTYQFPATDGNATQVLATDGNGQLSFVDQSGGEARTVKVDTNGDGTVNSTLDSSEELVLKAGEDITLAENSGVVTINSTTPMAEVSTIRWSGGPPIGYSTSVTSQASLTTSYTSTPRADVLSELRPTANSIPKTRIMQTQMRFNASLIGGSTTFHQNIYQRLQVQAPGSANSTINLGEATSHGFFGSSYGALGICSVAGDVTRYFTGGQGIATSGSLATSESGGSYARSVHSVYYNNSANKTYIYTTGFPTHVMSSTSGATTPNMYYDPFNWLSTGTYVTLHETRLTKYISNNGMYDNLTSLTILPYGSYGLQYKIDWRKTGSGSVNMEDFVSTITSLPTENTV